MPIRFRTSVQLTPQEMHKDFVDVLKQKLQKNLEGVCSRFGYIRPGSIEITRRSAGNFVKQHFNGHIRFELLCKAEVCNPPQDMVLKAVVRNKNAMGLLAESFLEDKDATIPVLDIIIPKRAAGIASEIDLDQVEIGDDIYISVQGKRFQLNDKKISIIGRAVKDPAINVNPYVDPLEDESLIQDGIMQEGGLSDIEMSEDEENEFGEEENSEDEGDVAMGGKKPANVKTVLADDEEKENESDEEEDIEPTDEFFEGEEDMDELDDLDEVVGGYDDFE